MKLKRILALIQIFCFAWMIFFIVPAPKTAALSNIGLGDISYVDSRLIANGVNLQYVVGNNFNGPQKAHTIEIAKGSLTPYSTYGTYVYGGEKLTSMIALAESKYNKKVVAAINGDFYDTGNGIPLGMMISDGKLVTSGSSVNSYPLLGFKADGTAIYGTPNISMKLNDGTSTLTINYLNVNRKVNEASIFMYTRDYGVSTKNDNSGREIVLNINNGEVKLGGTISATVESINNTNAEIGEGKIIISTATANAAKLDNLTIGKDVTITITDNKASEGWSEVIEAIGFNTVLANDGVLTSITTSNTDVHPRSAIGIKADGTVVLFQVDGRQPGWSMGATYKQIAEYLVNEKHCVTVLNLDGGGSSTIVARLPGYENGEILNVPSDGVERSNSNAILFFANDSPDPSKEVSFLHAYPNNLVILEGATTNLITKATDKNYYPVPTPTDITYQISDELGVIDQSGKFTARSGAGNGIITINYGSISTAINVMVVDQISKIVADKTYLSLAPGESAAFNLKVYQEGMPIVCSNSSFIWKLSSPALGTIENGIFIAANESATGSIDIIYKDYKITIPVEVGKQPKMISTFEDIAMGTDWKYVIENPGSGAVGTASINTDERYVKFGEKSLRIDYDFTKATSTTSVSVQPIRDNKGNAIDQIVLDGYPSHIGMWVYGDLGRANVRMMLYANGNVQYINFVPDEVNWDGWKYIEAEIPKGLPTPLTLKYPIRVMSVSGKVKSSGTLYFDNLRAVYGFKNDDISEPQIKDITPVLDSTVNSKQPTISATIWDAPDKNGILTGINKKSLKMWVNNQIVENLVIDDNDDGSIGVYYTPSALSVLRSGPQQVKLRVEDNYGNITIKKWHFYVAGDYVGVNGEIPDKDIIYGGDMINYYISANTYTNFVKLEATLHFNHQALEIYSVSTVDSNITLNSINRSIANSTGVAAIVATGMNDYIQPENQRLIKITFRTKNGFTGNSDSNIYFDNVKVYEKGYDNPAIFPLPSYEVKVNYKYIITYLTSTVGRDITFKVTDDQMNPVKDATFSVSGMNISGKTDEFGYATLPNFKNLAVDKTFTIKATKGIYYSENITITMVASLGTSTPNQIIVSPGEDTSNSVTISWQTNLDTTDSLVQYRPVGSENWQVVTEGITKDIHVIDKTVMREYLAHVATITGLEANTEYEYQVGNGITMSPKLMFKTTPSDDISMLLLGDPQNTNDTGYLITKKLIDAAIAKNPELSLMLLAGDIVDDVNMYEQWQAFERVLNSYTNKIITSAATGNHDVIRDYGDPFKYSLSGSRNGIAVLGANYYYEAGSAAIAVIDTETPSAYEAQALWLKEKMANTNKKFKIVLMHRSVYPANYNEPYVRNFWPAVFEEAGIDLVVSGHDHVYNSTTMAKNRQVSDNYGPKYIVLGSAGSKFYDANNLENRDWIDFLYDDNHNVFTNLEIKGNVMTIKSYALVGAEAKLINTIVINKDLKIAKEIAITDGINQIVAGNEYQFKAKLIDQDGHDFTGNVLWKLKENISGISISNDGKLVVSQDFDQNTEIEVIAYFESIEKVHSINVYFDLPSLSEVIDYLIKTQDKFINDIYK